MLSFIGAVFAEINPEWTYNLNTYDASSLVITPDGKDIVVSSYNNIYYFTKNRTLLWKYSLSDMNSRSFYRIKDISISNDGKYVVALVEYTSEYMIKKNNIMIFNKRGELVNSYQIKNEYMETAISSDGKYIVAVGGMTICMIDKNKGIIWDYETNGTINSMDMSSNGKYIVVGCDDGNVYMFNMSGLYKIYQTNGSVNGVSINPYVKLIGAGGNDKCIYLFTLDGRLLHKTNNSEEIYYLKITNNGNIIAYGWDTIYYFDKNLNTLWNYKINGDYIYQIKITPDGNYILFYNDYPRYYQLIRGVNEGLFVLNNNGKVTWHYPTDYVDSADITADGKYVVALIQDKLYLFNNKKCMNNYNPKDISHITKILTMSIEPRLPLLIILVISALFFIYGIYKKSK